MLPAAPFELARVPLRLAVAHRPGPDGPEAGGVGTVVGVVDDGAEGGLVVEVAGSAVVTTVELLTVVEVEPDAVWCEEEQAAVARARPAAAAPSRARFVVFMPVIRPSPAAGSTP
jgi:hypothetical protein